MLRRGFLGLLGMLPFVRCAPVPAAAAPLNEWRPGTADSNINVYGRGSLMGVRDLLLPAMYQFHAASSQRAQLDWDIVTKFEADVLWVKLVRLKQEPPCFAALAHLKAHGSQMALDNTIVLVDRVALWKITLEDIRSTRYIDQFKPMLQAMEKHLFYEGRSVPLFPAEVLTDAGHFEIYGVDS